MYRRFQNRRTVRAEFADLQSDYLNVNNYDYTGKKKIVINKMLKIMSGQLRHDSDYVYIRHYMTIYQYVPLWVLMNVLTIGQLSKIYASQKGRIQIKVCQEFGPLKVNELGKMLAVMTKFRNASMSVSWILYISRRITGVIGRLHFVIPRREKFIQMLWRFMCWNWENYHRKIKMKKES